MSVAYAGNYSFLITDLESNAKKRYVMAIQKGKPILDKEISEIAFRDLDFFRSYNMHNVGDAALGEFDFQIQESSISNVNNFKVSGGTSTDPALLVVKGYPLVLFSNIEYNKQDATGILTDDDFTETLIPALTTPGGPRVDEVYVDTYLAEVSSEVGSEYQDTTIKDGVLALQTANRFRIVQDIRVAEGAVTPADGVDGNGIYHSYLKIATLSRLAANATITTAMITDNRTIVNSNKSYEDGTALTIKLKDGEDIGDASHGIGTLFMASTIDYRTDLAWITSSSEKMRITTDGRLGIGTTLPVFKDEGATSISPTGLAIIKASDTENIYVGGTTGANIAFGAPNASGEQVRAASIGSIMTVTTDGSEEGDLVLYTNPSGGITEKLRILANGNVGVGTTSPADNLHLDENSVTGPTLRLQSSWYSGGAQPSTGDKQGDIKWYGRTRDNNLVTAGKIYTECTNNPTVPLNSYHRMSFGVNKASFLIDVLHIVSTPSISRSVGIGTTLPQATLHVVGDIVGRDNDTSDLGSSARRWANLYMASTIDYSSDLAFSSSGEKVRFKTDGKVGIGTATVTDNVQVYKSAGPSLSLQSDAANGTNHLRFRYGATIGGGLSVQRTTGPIYTTALNATSSTGIVNLSISGTPKVTVTNTGVGIGTTPNSLYNLHLYNSGGTFVNYQTADSDNNIGLRYYYGSTQVANFETIRISGNYTTTIGGFSGVTKIRSGFGANSQVITAAGDVGIGTDTPQGKLHTYGSGTISEIINGSSTCNLWLRRGSSYDALFTLTSLQSSIGTQTSLPFNIKTAGANAIQISTSQKIGIGTAPSANSLHLYSTSATEYYLIYSELKGTNGTRSAIFGKSVGSNGAGTNIGVRAQAGLAGTNHPFQDNFNNYSDSGGWVSTSHPDKKRNIRNITQDDKDIFWNVLDTLVIKGYRFKEDTIIGHDDKNLIKDENGFESPTPIYDSDENIDKYRERFGLMSTELPEFLETKKRDTINPKIMTDFLVAIVQMLKGEIANLKLRIKTLEDAKA